MLISECINIILKTQPKNKVIKSFQTDIRFLITMNKDALYDMFKPYMEIFKLQIAASNVEYFLKIDPRQYTQIQENIDKIEQLRSLWLILPLDDREEIRTKVAQVQTLF